jgi:hypothetical protein
MNEDDFEVFDLVLIVVCIFALYVVGVTAP